MTISPIYW